ncbi:zinc metalloprotease HtpX [Citricoccus nitrophenolicus]|uniref:Protease HtpX homolog n=1 Tax=Citricoccus nitrophenolicus TaxID=863575 RepID=A0ABV0IH95_9MICC
MTRHHNGLKTTLLFAGLFAVLLAIGGVIAAGTGRAMWIGVFAVIGVGTTAYSYWNSDKIAIRSMRAYPVTEMEQPEMYRIVAELSQAANQPMPRLYVAPTASPNAFATGRNPQHAAVCCTEGILRILNARELRGVLGHELMHVYNRDILTSSVAAAVAGVITSVAQFMMFFGAGRGNRGGNPLAMIALAILAPLAASLIQMSISRTREYDADEDGAQLTGDPLALASALYKLQNGIQAAPLPDEQRLQNTAHLMIANPFKNVRNMFSTHPPMAERVKRLEGMARQLGQG